eukprot:TRINITY_DN39248_c0_g1_i1.p1 TRINITY_DN39248_c0_g1~~TRINITY_DN39248_c0_g1_i1.p1  ORF type:complete len:213 (-),score=35.95 TRINITY_DN39248_c0_g1_i1:161-799(-)
MSQQSPRMPSVSSRPSRLPPRRLGGDGGFGPTGGGPRGEWPVPRGHSRPHRCNDNNPFQFDKPYAVRETLARDRAMQRKSDLTGTLGSARSWMDEPALLFMETSASSVSSAWTDVTAKPSIMTKEVQRGLIGSAIPGYKGFKPGYGDASFAVGQNYCQQQDATTRLRLAGQSQLPPSLERSFRGLLPEVPETGFDTSQRRGRPSAALQRIFT